MNDLETITSSYRPSPVTVLKDIVNDSYTNGALQRAWNGPAGTAFKIITSPLTIPTSVRRFFHYCHTSTEELNDRDDSEGMDVVQGYDGSEPISPSESIGASTVYSAEVAAMLALADWCIIAITDMKLAAYTIIGANIASGVYEAGRLAYKAMSKLKEVYRKHEKKLVDERASKINSELEEILSQDVVHNLEQKAKDEILQMKRQYEALQKQLDYHDKVLKQQN